MSFFPVQAQNFKLHGAGVVIGATTVKLTSFAQIDGTLLTMSDFGSKGYITIEPGVTNEEQISFTGVTQNSDGTATLTGVSTVGMVQPFTETSGIAIAHVGGTIAILSNTAGLYSQYAAKSNAETITGTWTFAVASYPRVSSAATLPTADEMLATKKYVDGVAVSGAPTSGTNVLGIVKLSTAAVVGTSPIVVGDNDTRVPTQGENDAMAGTRGTPSSTNKFVTNDDTSTTGTTQYVVRYSGTGLITVASTPTDNTDAASKSYVDASGSRGWKTGFGNKNISDAGTTLLIAHGLGTTPREVMMDFWYSTSTTSPTAARMQVSYSSNSVSGTSFQALGVQNNGNVSWALEGGFALRDSNTSGNLNYQTGVMSVDGTNISIVWTKTGSPASQAHYYIWKAFA